MIRRSVRGHRSGLLFVLMLSAAALRAPAVDLIALDDTPHVTNMLPKPAAFDSWEQRLEFLHYNVPIILNAQTYRADTLFLADGVTPVKEPPRTQLRLGIYVEAKDDEGFEAKFDPDFEVDVSLPNLEHTWKIFVQSAENDELPGVDATERDRGAQVGVRRQLEGYNINLDAGVRATWLPEAFAKAEWRPDYWVAEKWRISPRQRVYVESDDGFGEVTQFQLLRWFGATKQGIFQTVSAAKWTEKSDGVEWEQSVKIGRAIGLLKEQKRGQTNVKSEDATRGYGARYSVFGHDDGNFVIDRHRFTLLYRFPIHKDWIFMDILPEVEWKDEDDWDIGPGIRVGFDALFWGG